jgi:hypothetical protein
MSRWQPPKPCALAAAWNFEPDQKELCPIRTPQNVRPNLPHPVQPLLRTADCCLLAGWQVRSFTAYVDRARGHLKKFCKVFGNRRGWVRPKCRSLQIAAMFVVRHRHWKKFCKVLSSSKMRGGGAGLSARTNGPAYVTRRFFFGSQVGR